MEDLYNKIHEMLDLGFTIDYEGLVSICKAEAVYEVDWVSYRNPHDNFVKEERCNFFTSEIDVAIYFFFEKLNIFKNFPPDRGSWSI